MSTVSRYVLVAFLVVVAFILMMYVDCRISGDDVGECRSLLAPSIDRLERLGGKGRE